MSTKKQRLVETALNLFYQQGIHSIGINEVLKSSGVAKRTLYTHFESKDALVLAALELRHARFLSWLNNLLVGANNSQELIDALFDGLSLWFKSQTPELGDFRGCFFINASAEFSDPHSDISRYCATHKREVRNTIAQSLQADDVQLLDAICMMKEGAITTAYLNPQAEDPAQKAKRVLHSLNHIGKATSLA